MVLPFLCTATSIHKDLTFVELLKYGMGPFEANLDIDIDLGTPITLEIPEQLDTLCVDNGLTAVTGGMPLGGSYSGTGVSDDGNGTSFTFDPAAAGPGLHLVTYSYDDGDCSGMFTDFIHVFDLPNVNFSALDDLTIEDGIQTGLGNGTPIGGIYNGPGVIDDGNGMTYTFNPELAGIGVHSLNYQYTDNNGCSAMQSDDVEVTTSLPVVWSRQLTAKKSSNKIKISFSTAQQINNSHFEIEHSKEGSNHKTIDRLEGEGNTTEETLYEFIHENPTRGTNYYRVKQVDYDGQYSYSNVASVIYGTDKVSVYPNPVNDLLTVNSPNGGSVAIYNQLGLVVGGYKLVGGQNEVDMSNMSDGIYLLKFFDGSVERLVKK